MKRSIPCLLAAAPMLLSALAGAAGLPNYDGSYDVVRAAPPAASLTRAPAAFVASTDARRGAPSFVWAARDVGLGLGRVPGMTPERAAREHLARHASRYGLSREALATARVEQIHDTGRGGIIVVMRQALGGVEVLRSDAKVLLDRNLDLVAIAGSLHPAAVGRPKGASSSIGGHQAIAIALADLHGLSVSDVDVVQTKETKGPYRHYDLGAAPAMAQRGISFGRPAREKRVYFAKGDALVPAYYLEVLTEEAKTRASHAYAYVIAADDGRLLQRQNLTHDDAFQYRVWADTSGDLRPTDGPIADFTPHPAGAPDGSYPAFTAPSLISIDGFNKFKDPWLPSGATQTKGNNVDAYTDDGAPDGFSGKDTRATITSPGVFDRVYDTAQDPQASVEQKMAAVTQVFYVTNWLHDWWYDSGFDEAAGNAQSNNYGRGGLGGDPLHAEGQDRAPDQRNNANMSVFADGSSPRMQMFVWDGKGQASLSAQPLNQTFGVGVADFGPQSFVVMDQPLVLAVDGTAPIHDICESVTNDLTGMVALIERGQCSFASKVSRAQSAGAIGVIIANNNPSSTPPPMGGGVPGIAIPVLSVTELDGATLKAALMSSSVSVTMQREPGTLRDGTIDNTVVAHEWGHYLHLRQVGCSSAMCAAESEGWADFVAAHMMVRAGDDLQGAYPAAVYATASFPDDPAYFGIRRYPYSVDFSKNALTFKHITDGQDLPAGVPVAQSNAFVNNAEAHAAGEVWASMLFEGYIALLKQTEGPSPKYTFDEARRRMGDYVTAGLKLAPDDPTYTEQRDAILAAAAASDAGDLAILAKAFARRGAGTCAVSPPRDSQDFAGVKESFTVDPVVSIVSMTLDESVKSCDQDGYLDAEETGKLTVTVMNGGIDAMPSATAVVSSTTTGVIFPAGTTLTFGPIAALGTGTASIDVKLDNKLTKVENAEIRVDLLGVTSCGDTPSATIHPRVNFDQVPASSAVDTVEADNTVWTPQGDGAEAIWSRIEADDGNHVWSGVDYPSPSDTSLISPLLEVSATESFVLSFDHRHSFEESNGAYWDGSVIELSIDGTSWKDISTFADPGYGGTIGDPQNQAQNALKDRQGYVGTSASWPAMDSVKIDLGAQLAGKSVRVRFRVASDDALGATGWEIDNIALQGITSTPFASIVDDKGSCGVPPVANAGPDQMVSGATVVKLDGSKSVDPDGVPLTFTWKETTSVGVELSDPSSPTPTFVAPGVSSPQKISFELTVSDGSASASDTIDVVVSAPPQPIEPPPGTTSAPPAVTPGGGCACSTSARDEGAGAGASIFALLALAARRRRKAQPGSP